MAAESDWLRVFSPLLSFKLLTHDAWGVVNVGEFTSLEEARAAFRSLCADPWYRSDGTVKGVELVECDSSELQKRLEWFSYL
jgi:hypothetical protein